MNYELITIPTITVLLAQIIKLATDKTKGNLDIINILNKYGGMPSSHTSFVTSLGTLIALKEGFNSVAFAIWFVFSVIVIKNALGLRQEVSRHSVAIEKIAREKKVPIPQLTHRLGHKPIEVIAGFFFGLTITLIIKFLIN